MNADVQGDQIVLVDSSNVKAYIFNDEPDGAWVRLRNTYFIASPDDVSVIINRQQLAALSAAYSNLPKGA